MMRQVGLIACIKDDEMLKTIARTGKLGTSHGVDAADIARQVVCWCSAHAHALASWVALHRKLGGKGLFTPHSPFLC